MKKYYFVLIWLIAITVYLLWPKGSYNYLKLNSVVGNKPIVLFERDFYSFGNKREFYLTSRSYVQGQGNGIVAIELNGEIIDSGDTLVNPSTQIQSQSIVRARNTKFGKNKLRVLSWIDNGDKFVVASLGFYIK